MYKNEFQGGASVEIFSAQGKEPVAKWKLFGSSSSIKKVYDRDVKSYVYCIEGSSAVTKMQLPKDNKQTLFLIQRFLLFQLFVPVGQDFCVELGISDMGNNKKRLFLSTSHKEIVETPLHCKVPLTVLKRGMWLNLCLDLGSLVSEGFHGQTLKALESITISANCKLRRVATLKLQPLDSTDDDELYDLENTNNCEVDIIPRTLQYNTDIAHLTQVLTMAKIRKAEIKIHGPNPRRSLSCEDLTSIRGGVVATSRRQADDRPTQIAFGSKVSVPLSLQSRKGSGEKQKDGNSTSRNSTFKGANKPTHKSDVPTTTQSAGPRLNRNDIDLDSSLIIHSLHNRQNSDPGLAIIVPVDQVSGVKANSTNMIDSNKELVPPHQLRPHPPRDKSAGGGGNSRRRLRIRRASDTRDRSVEQRHHDIVDEDLSTSSTVSNITVSHSSSGKDSGIASGTETNTVLKHMTNELMGNGVHGERKHEDSDVEDPLASSADSTTTLKNLSQQETGVGTQHSAEEGGNTERVFTFSSTPHSAPRPHTEHKRTVVRGAPCDRVSSTTDPGKKRAGNRGPPPEDDFKRTPSSDDEYLVNHTPDRHRLSDERDRQTSPTQTDDSRGHFRTQISPRYLREISPDQQRLSNDYDWRNYQSDDGQSTASSIERNMLASLKRQQLEEGMSEDDMDTVQRVKQSLHKHEFGNDSLSSSSDDTSFGTWRPPELNQHGNWYADEMISGRDTLTQSNPRDWTSAFSPPIMPISERIASNGAQGVLNTIPVSGKGDGVSNGDFPQDEEEELDLLYDPTLNCYFDPKSGKYYQLA